MMYKMFPERNCNKLYYPGKIKDIIITKFIYLKKKLIGLSIQYFFLSVLSAIFLIRVFSHDSRALSLLKKKHYEYHIN